MILTLIPAPILSESERLWYPDQYSPVRGLPSQSGAVSYGALSRRCKSSGIAVASDRNFPGGPYKACAR